MTKRALTILIVAVVLVAGATIAIAGSLGGDDDSGPTHVMPGGQTMTGEGMHTMENGETMSDDDMQK